MRKITCHQYTALHKCNIENKKKFKEILEKDYENQSAYKNTEARNHELASLMSQMENWFDIPFLLEDAKKETSPKVLNLYQEISNARDFSIY